MGAKLRFFLLACAAIFFAACVEPAPVSVDPVGIDRTGDTIMARVDGSEVYLSDVARLAVAQARAETVDEVSPEMEEFDAVLGEVISQRILSMAAEEQGLDQTDEAQRRFALARERELGNLLVERHLEATVSEAALRELYEAQLALRESVPQVRGRHLLVATEEGAQAALARLEAGEMFVDVAAELSLDEATAALGGTLDWFTRESFETAFTDAAFATKVGNVSAPVQTSFGWHVIKIEERRSDSPPGFEDLREELSAFLTYDAIEALLRDLREAADVEMLVEDKSE